MDKNSVSIFKGLMALSLVILESTSAMGQLPERIKVSAPIKAMTQYVSKPSFPMRILGKKRTEPMRSRQVSINTIKGKIKSLDLFSNVFRNNIAQTPVCVNVFGKNIIKNRFTNGKNCDIVYAAFVI